MAENRPITKKRKRRSFVRWIVALLIVAIELQATMIGMLGLIDHSVARLAPDQAAPR